MGRRGTRSTVGIPGSGLSYSSGGGKSALLPGLILAALVALFYHAARGSRAAQVTLLVIGLGGVVLFVSGRHPESRTAETITVQAPSASQATPPASGSNGPAVVTEQVAPESTRISAPEATVPVTIEAPVPAHSDVVVPASPTGVGPIATTSSTSAEPSVVVLKTANVRSAPSLSGTVLTQLPVGTELRGVEISGRWAQVRRGDDVLGWINLALLDRAPEPDPATAYSQ